MSNSRELYVKYKKCQNEVLADIFGPEYMERSIGHLVGQSKALGAQNKKTRRKLGQLILYRQEAATHYPPCDRHQGFIKALKEIYENISPSSPQAELLPTDTSTIPDQSYKTIQTDEEDNAQAPFDATSVLFKDETFKNSELYIFLDEIEVFVQTLCEFWDGASGADLVSASLGMFLASPRLAIAAHLSSATECLWKEVVSWVHAAELLESEGHTYATSHWSQGSCGHPFAERVKAARLKPGEGAKMSVTDQRTK